MRNALLWQIEYPSGQQSYIFGSMHVRDKVAYSFAEKAIEYIESCERYYAEIDMAEASQKISIDDYLIPEGLMWTTMLSDKAYKRMHKHCLRLSGVDLEDWKRFYPLIVINKIMEQEMNDDNDLALDAFLYERAAQAGLKTSGVESVDFQIELMKSLDINAQLQMLKRLCRKLSAHRKEVHQLKIDYEQQDILGLYKKTRKSLGSMRGLLLRERNYNMAQSILNDSRNKSFFTIGAAHLAGPYGVLRILKQNSIELQALSI